MRWYCFAVGLNNFRWSRRSMVEIAADIGKAFSRSKPRLHLEAWFGATGNIAVTTDAEISAENLARRLRRATDLSWATLPADQLDIALAALAEWPAPPPPRRPRARWTPGLALAVGDTSTADIDIPETDRAQFRWIAPTVIGVYKRDLLNDGGTLHKNRLGGWGAVSGDVHRRVGGVWTARSTRPLEGLRRVALGQVTRRH